MTRNDQRPPGCTAYTPFEEELVNAMNDFVKTAEAPNFDTAGIVRRARRKRATVIAGVATALVVACGGTALAAISSGSEAPASKPAATAASTDEGATVLYEFSDGGVVPLELGGMNLDMAKAQFEKARLKLGTVGKEAVKGCKPGSVLEADPHSPKTVKSGDTVNLTLCAG